MMSASASFGLTWENYREDNLFQPKYIMIVTWKFSFPEMTFSGPDCNSGDWDPSESFKKHAAALLDQAEEGSAAATDIKEMHDRVHFLKKDVYEEEYYDEEAGNLTREWQIWSIELLKDDYSSSMVGKEDSTNYVRSHGSNPINVLFDWLQTVCPKTRRLGDWGLSALLIDEYDKTSICSFLFLEDGTMQECQMRPETPPDDEKDGLDDFDLPPIKPPKIFVSFTAKGDLKKYVLP